MNQTPPLQLLFTMDGQLGTDLLSPGLKSVWLPTKTLDQNRIFYVQPSEPLQPPVPPDPPDPPPPPWWRDTDKSLHHHPLAIVWSNRVSKSQPSPLRSRYIGFSLFVVENLESNLQSVHDLQFVQDFQEKFSELQSTFSKNTTFICCSSPPASSVSEFLAVDFALTPAIDLASTPAVDNTPAVDYASIRMVFHPWIVWFLWTSRNTLFFENRASSVSAKEWQEAQVTRPSFAPPSSTSPSSVLIAITPAPHHFTCYVVASWICSSLQAGLGWFLEDPLGTEIAQGPTTHQFTSSALMAEAHALKTALEAATLLDIHHLTGFSDSLSLVSLISSNGVINELKSVRLDIRCFIETFSSISISFISRSLNVKADSLAKAALNSIVLAS